MFRIISPIRIELDGSYRIKTPRPELAPEPVAIVAPATCRTCPEPPKAGCGGHCLRCWQERRALHY